MQSDNLFRHIWVPFAIAILVYVIFYGGIEHRRTRNGPWQVAFTNDAAGAPELIINQPKLGITNAQIAFPGETTTNAPESFTFAQPKEVPCPFAFSKCVFMDTTFLPGTLVFDLFGHEIQLIPRALTIDQKETSWKSNERIDVPRTNAPAASSGK